MMSCDQQVYALGISNCWVCIFGGMDWEWGAHPSDRTCLTGFFRPPTLCQSLQNFRKFAIDWLQQRLRRLRAASGPCSCPPNPYTSDPIRSVAIRCDPLRSRHRLLPKEEREENKNVYAFFLVTDRTQGFSYSAVQFGFCSSFAALRKLHAHKN